MATPTTLDVIVASVLAGDPGCDADGCCLGCGRLVEHVANGAASGCRVCLAFLDWMYGPEGNH